MTHVWDDTKGPSFHHWLAGEPPSGLTESWMVLLLTGDRSLSKAEGVATPAPGFHHLGGGGYGRWGRKRPLRCLSWLAEVPLEVHKLKTASPTGEA